MKIKRKKSSTTVTLNNKVQSLNESMVTDDVSGLPPSQAPKKEFKSLSANVQKVRLSLDYSLDCGV